MPEDVRCPICGSNLRFYNTMQREQHADACLEKLEVAEDTVPLKIPTNDEDALCVLEDSQIPDVEAAGQDGMMGEETAATTVLSGGDVETEESQTSPRKSESSAIPYTSHLASEVCRESVDLGTLHTRDQPHLEEPLTLGKRSGSIEICSVGEPLKRQKKRNMPFYKVLHIGDKKFAVDAFQYGAIKGVSAYFLTHFHSDHYGGLSKNWSHGSIICTPATSRLVQMKLRVDPQYIREIDTNVPTSVEGVDVVFFDANHCPGAVIILFDRCVLHTGDFRADARMLAAVKKYTQQLSHVYLDTTYMDPKRTFPSQDLVVNTCSQFCALEQARPASRAWFTRQKPRRLLVLVGTYTIGKERLAVAVAHSLKSQIWANDTKRRVLTALGDRELNNLLNVDNGLTCQVHLAPMGDLVVSKLVDQWRFLQKHYTELVAFVPTGWSWPTKSAGEFNADIMTRSATKRGPIRIFRVPYSEHSSFTELESFCRGIPISRIIATVPTPYSDILKQWEYKSDQDSNESPDYK